MHRAFTEWLPDSLISNKGEKHGFNKKRACRIRETAKRLEG